MKIVAAFWTAVIAPTARSIAARSAVTRGVARWAIVTATAAAIMTAIDAVLLQRSNSFFTGGFLIIDYLAGPADVAVFLGLSLLVNTAVVGPLCAVCLALSSKLRWTRFGEVLLVFIVGLCPLLMLAFVNYELWRYLGANFDMDLFLDLSGGDFQGLIATAAPELLRSGAGILLVIWGVLLIVWPIKRRVTRHATIVRPISVRAVAVGAVTLLLLGLTTVTATALWSRRFDYGMRRIAAGQFLGNLANRATDMDADGYGLLRGPRDPAPRDPAIHPYAVDVPGNAIDENGVAGDLSVDASRYVESAASFVPWRAYPPVVFIVLESVRADAVGATLNGRPVTPVMDALARSGVRSEHAYSHNGYTAQSRYHLLTGSLAGLRGDTGIFDDFKAQGYEVAYFAGGDETFGRMPVSLRSVDVYYDARQDKDKRVSTFTSASSLAVPGELIEARIDQYLTKRDSTRPLFLYINLHDAHFPYHHAGIRPLIDSTALPRYEISADRRDDVHRTYLNTLSNVDMTVGRILDRVRRDVGRDPGVVIVSDHGESLFEGGFLGHGHSLNDVQTRIPLIVANLPLLILEPFGQMDLRDSLYAALASLPGDGSTRHPRTVPGVGRRIFQYIGVIERPSQIAFRERDRRVSYDFKRQRFDAGHGWKSISGLSDDEVRLFRELVSWWEAIRLAQMR